MASPLTPLAAALLEAYARGIRERLGSRVVEVRAFGSYARGDATEDSDLDILVLIDGMTAQDRWEAIHLASGLTVEHGFALDVSAHPLDAETFRKWLSQERRFALDARREGIPA